MSAQTASVDEWMSPEEMAELAQTTVETLANQRAQYKTWPFHKVPGSRAVWYHRPTIEAMLKAGEVKVRVAS